MLYLGPDVVIMSFIALFMIFVSCFATRNAEQDTAKLVVSATAITAVTMTLGYVIMARVLDSMLGAYGW